MELSYIDVMTGQKVECYKQKHVLYIHFHLILLHIRMSLNNCNCSALHET